MLTGTVLYEMIPVNSLVILGSLEPHKNGFSRQKPKASEPNNA
jgi:hypothetical protein